MTLKTNTHTHTHAQVEAAAQVRILQVTACPPKINHNYEVITAEKRQTSQHKDYCYIHVNIHTIENRCIYLYLFKHISTKTYYKY